MICHSFIVHRNKKAGERRKKREEKRSKESFIDKPPVSHLTFLMLRVGGILSTSSFLISRGSRTHSHTGSCRGLNFLKQTTQTTRFRVALSKVITKLKKKKV